MAIQTLDTRKPLSPGQQISKGLVSGLGGYLEKLSESKVKEIERQRFAQGLQGLGFEAKEAQGLSQLPPELQKSLIAAKGVKSKEEAKAEHAAEKESQKFITDVAKEYKGAQESNKRLDRMTQLIEKGSLPFSSTYRLFKNLSETEIGKNIPIIGSLAALTVNPVLQGIGGLGGAVQRNITARDSEEFEKLQADFIKLAKDFFPGRVSDADLKAFVQTLPTLAQSDSGKLRIIENMKNFNKAAELRYNIAKAIIRANGGKRPKNLELLVEEYAGPELENLASGLKMSPTRALIPGSGI